MPEYEQLELKFEARVRFLTVDEIYNLKNTEWLKLIKEDRRIERKPASQNPRALGDYFSMWANTAPHGGIIAVGVSANGDFHGIVNTAIEHINKLENTGNIFCSDARCDMKRVAILNEDGAPDELLLFRVHYNEKKVVRTSEGTAFDRRGESKRELNEEQIRELQIEKGEVAWERGPTEQTFPEAFDQRALSEFGESVVAKMGLEHAGGIESILAYRHLGRFVDQRFIANKACALLFSKDPSAEIPGCRIRFLRFDGKEESFGEKRNTIKDVWIAGNIPQQLLKAQSVVGDQLREFSRLGRDGKSPLRLNIRNPPGTRLS